MEKEIIEIDDVYEKLLELMEQYSVKLDSNSKDKLYDKKNSLHDEKQSQGSVATMVNDLGKLEKLLVPDIRVEDKAEILNLVEKFYRTNKDEHRRSIIAYYLNLED